MFCLCMVMLRKREKVEGKCLVWSEILCSLLMGLGKEMVRNDIKINKWGEIYQQKYARGFFFFFFMKIAILQNTKLLNDSWILYKCYRINLLVCCPSSVCVCDIKRFDLKNICSWCYSCLAFVVTKGTTACRRWIGNCNWFILECAVLFLYFWWEQESIHCFSLQCLLTD